MKLKILLLIATVLTLPTVSCAASDGVEASGLPQLDLTTWPTQLFWLTVTFVIMFALMSTLVSPRIRNVLEDRQKRISSDLQKAREADTQASEMRANYEASLAAARSEAAKQARDAVNQAKATAERAEAKMVTTLNRKLKTAETKLAKIRERAMLNIDNVAAEITAETVNHLTGMKPTKAAVSKSLKATLASRAKQEAS